MLNATPTNRKINIDKRDGDEQTNAVHLIILRPTQRIASTVIVVFLSLRLSLVCCCLTCCSYHTLINMHRIGKSLSPNRTLALNCQHCVVSLLCSGSLQCVSGYKRAGLNNYSSVYCTDLYK